MYPIVRVMRLLTLEEREDLCRRADCDILDFVQRVRNRRRLAKLLRSPRETDLPRDRILRVRNHLAEEGYEYSPAELESTISKLCCKVRNVLRDKGFSEDMIPDSDVLLLEVLHDSQDAGNDGGESL